MYSYIYICVIAVFLDILLLNKDHKTKNAIHTHILHKDAGRGTPKSKVLLTFIIRISGQYLLNKCVDARCVVTSCVHKQLSFTMLCSPSRAVATSSCIQPACSVQASVERGNQQCRWLCDLYIVLIVFTYHVYFNRSTVNRCEIFIMFCSQWEQH